MKLSTLKRIPLRWRARVLSTGFNLNPAYCTLCADFRLDQADLARIGAELDADGETSRRYTIELKDQAGTVYTVVERMVYIADKAFYKQNP